MFRSIRLLPVMVSVVVVAACSGDGSSPASSPTAAQSPTPSMSVFVSSATSVTGNLGGLKAADRLCQQLATSVGQGAKTWHAYLSVQSDPDNGGRPTDARSRIGSGPWYNANRQLVATDLEDLHARAGNSTLFVDERGQPINGQWPGSPRPVEHDILTGSTAEGRMLIGTTCADWTSASTALFAQVGHSDGLGPNGDTSGALSSWNSAHQNQDCSNTAPRGGAGRIYCFAVN